MGSKFRVVCVTSLLTITHTLAYFFSVSRRGYFICRDAVINVNQQGLCSDNVLGAKSFLTRYLVFSSNQEIPHILWNPKVHYLFLKSLPFFFYSEIVQPPPPSLFRRSILILSSYYPPPQVLKDISFLHVLPPTP